MFSHTNIFPFGSGTQEFWTLVFLLAYLRPETSTRQEEDVSLRRRVRGIVVSSVEISPLSLNCISTGGNNDDGEAMGPTGG